MKKMKKLLSLVLAMMLVLAMGSTAMASQPTSGNNEEQRGRLTVENAIPGQTYSIYKIFDLVRYSSEADEEERAFAYKVTDAWEEFVAGDGKNYVTVDERGYITWIGQATAERAQEFAKLALAYAETNNISAETETAGADRNVVFSELELGYYLVDSTTGTLCSLDTTQTDVVMTEKNKEPAVDKKIKDGENSVDENTASIGDTVEFKVIIDVKDGAENYVLHDKMSDGLTFNGVENIKVLLDGVEQEAAGKYVAVSGGTETGTEEDPKCTFEVKFENSFLATLTDENVLVVTYTATVNKNAVIAGEGNPNEAKLDYGDDSSTEWDKTVTKVFDLDIFKYTMLAPAEGGDPVATGLAGAKFTLSTRDAEGKETTISFGGGKTTDENDVDVYKVVANGTEGAVTEITTNEKGLFRIEGLKAGKYYLTETKAPENYNMLPKPILIEITTDGTVKIGTIDINTDEETMGDTPVDRIEVLNNTGAELPSTGGIGTTIFYVLGGILVVGAGIMLVVKKRMSSEK